MNVFFSSSPACPLRGDGRTSLLHQDFQQRDVLNAPGSLDSQLATGALLPGQHSVSRCLVHPRMAPHPGSCRGRWGLGCCVLCVRGDQLLTPARAVLGPSLHSVTWHMVRVGDSVKPCPLGLTGIPALFYHNRCTHWPQCYGNTWVYGGVILLCGCCQLQQRTERRGDLSAGGSGRC